MGDSHAAALKYGWLRIQNDFPDAEITFFAGDQKEWHGVALSDGKLVAGENLREQFRRSANGVDAIEADFDAYILCGLGLGFIMPLGFWANGAYPDWTSYQGAVAAFIRHSGCAHVLPLLRQITAARTLVSPGPFQPSAFCQVSSSLDSATAAKLRANYLEQCRALATDHDAILVEQPEETLAPNRIATRMEFARKAAQGAREDRRHCNAEYGAIAMTNILRNHLRQRSD
jgi:hypothetical protein